MWLFDIMIKKKPSFNAMTKFVINLTYYGAPQTHAHKTTCIAYDLYEYNIQKYIDFLKLHIVFTHDILYFQGIRY